MQSNTIFSALSAEIRSGQISENSLDSLQRAFQEEELMSAEEHEYLHDILETAAHSR